MKYFVRRLKLNKILCVLKSNISVLKFNISTQKLSSCELKYQLLDQ